MSGESQRSKGYPCNLEAKELSYINQRRSIVGNSNELPNIDSARAANGLAFSGGGIRSATFCLGVIQGLVKNEGPFKHFDYMSTVSGGGYIGSFVGALYSRSDTDRKKLTNGAGAGQPEDLLTNENAKPLHWLRENGRYMAPNGGGDYLLGMAIYLRNWLTLLLLVAIPVAGLMAAVILLRGAAEWLIFHFPIARELYALFFGSNWAVLSPFWLWTFVPVAWFVVSGVVFWIGLALEKCGCLCPRSGAEWRRFWTAGAANGILLLLLTIFLALADSLGDYLATPSLGSGVTKFVVLLGGALLSTQATGIAKLLLAGGSGGGKIAASLSMIAGIAALLVTLFLLGLASAGVQHVTDSDGVGRRVDTPKSYARKAPGPSIVRTVRAEERNRAALAESTKDCEHCNDKKKCECSKVCPTTAGASDEKSAQKEATPPSFRSYSRAENYCVLLVLAVSIVLCLASTGVSNLGQLAFLNSGSIAPLYTARLRRAYLGASNAIRHNSRIRSVSIPVDGDDISLTDYKPHKAGGPLHLINVTVNETAAGETGIDQFDRKGLQLCVGPAGLSVGRRHHALWNCQSGLAHPTHDLSTQPAPRGYWGWFWGLICPGSQEESKPFYVFNTKKGERTIAPESLTLSQWIGISGAAFSTGLGQRNSMGYSLLLGLLNVRLGYWWNSGVDPLWRGSAAISETRDARFSALLGRMFPVQGYLLNELTCRFHGTARRHWNLSDGGHFENTACYELIRRRVRFILLCDCGADPDYSFEDLANLTRKVRTDFGAEIEFLTATECAKFKGVHPLEHLKRGDWKKIDPPTKTAPFTDQETYLHTVNRNGYALGHAALAKITYKTAAEPDCSDVTYLLVLKPTVTGDEPVDILNYHNSNADYPQQTTMDQFFDEAQWESYRRLGEHIATEMKEVVEAGIAGKIG